VAKESGVGALLRVLICARDICSTVAKEPLRECVLGNVSRFPHEMSGSAYASEGPVELGTPLLFLEDVK